MKFRFYLIKFIALVIFNQFGFSQTLLIDGIVQNESGIGISHVNILALPSKVGTQTDKNGEFKLSIIESDSILYISHIGYKDSKVLIEKLNKPLIVQLEFQIIKMTELDVSGRSRTHFNEIESKNNVVEIDVDDMVIRGFVDIGDALFSEQSIMMDETNTGEKTMSVRGSSSDELIFLYDGIRINNMGDPNLDLSSFSSTGLSALELVKGNHDLALSSSGTINLIPKLSYGKNFSFNQQFGTYDYGGYDSHLSLGNQYVAITSGLGKSNFSQLYSGHITPDILTQNSRHFINIGIKPNNKVEGKIMTFSSDKQYSDLFTFDSVNSIQKNYVGKLNLSHSTFGDISLYGLSQSISEKEKVGFSTIDKKGNHYSSGLVLKKQIKHALFQFRVNQSNLFADWELETPHFIINRKQMDGAGFLEIVQPERKGVFLKDAKIVFEFSEIKDVPHKSSDSLSIENWSESQALFTTSIAQNGKEFESNYYLNVGNTFRFPSLQERIANIVYTNSNSLSLSPEHKLTYEFGIKIDGVNTEGNRLKLSLSSFRYNYSNKIKLIQFSGKPLQYPINYGDASIMGFDANMNLMTDSKLLEFSSSYSKYVFSDILAFPLQPENISRSTLKFKLKKIQSVVTYRRESSRVLAVVNIDDNEFTQNRLPEIENIDIGITVIIPWKDWQISTSISGKNLLNQSIELNGISLFDKRYTFSVGISWK